MGAVCAEPPLGGDLRRSPLSGVPLLTRVNLLLTYAEHLQARWQRKPTEEEMQPIAKIITWNVWQMDGLHLSVPGGKPQPEAEQLNLFSMFGTMEEQTPAVSCKVKNWRSNKTQNFETIQEGSTMLWMVWMSTSTPGKTLDDQASLVVLKREKRKIH